MPRAKLERIYSKVDPSKYTYKIVFEDEVKQKENQERQENYEAPWAAFGIPVDHELGFEAALHRANLFYNITFSSILCVPNRVFSTSDVNEFTVEDFQNLMVLPGKQTILVRDDTWEILKTHTGARDPVCPKIFFECVWKFFNEASFRVEMIGDLFGNGAYWAIGRHRSDEFEYRGSRFIRQVAMNAFQDFLSPSVYHFAYNTQSHLRVPIDFGRHVRKTPTRGHQWVKKTKEGPAEYLTKFSSKGWDTDWERWKIYMMRGAQLPSRPMQIAKFATLAQKEIPLSFRLELLEDLPMQMRVNAKFRERVRRWIVQAESSPYLTTRATQGSLLGDLLYAIGLLYNPYSRSTPKDFFSHYFMQGFGIERLIFNHFRNLVKDRHEQKISPSQNG